MPHARKFSYTYEAWQAARPFNVDTLKEKRKLAASVTQIYTNSVFIAVTGASAKDAREPFSPCVYNFSSSLFSKKVFLAVYTWAISNI